MWGILVDRETGSCLIEVSALSRRSQYIVTPQRTLVPSVSTAYLHRDRIEANLFTHGSPESRVTTAPRYSCSTAFASARSMAWVNSALASTAPTRALTQLSGDIVNEFLSVPELAIGSDSHSALVHTTFSKPFCSSS